MILFPITTGACNHKDSGSSLVDSRNLRKKHLYGAFLVAGAGHRYIRHTLHMIDAWRRLSGLITYLRAPPLHRPDVPTGGSRCPGIDLLPGASDVRIPFPVLSAFLPELCSVPHIPSSSDSRSARRSQARDKLPLRFCFVQAALTLRAVS